jgi:hypothetical protein
VQLPASSGGRRHGNYSRGKYGQAPGRVMAHA